MNYWVKLNIKETKLLIYTSSAAKIFNTSRAAKLLIKAVNL